MHHNSVISGSHACRDCVCSIILGADLYTTQNRRQKVFNMGALRLFRGA